MSCSKGEVVQVSVIIGEMTGCARVSNPIFIWVCQDCGAHFTDSKGSLFTYWLISGNKGLLSITESGAAVFTGQLPASSWQDLAQSLLCMCPVRNAPPERPLLQEAGPALLLLPQVVARGGTMSVYINIFEGCVEQNRWNTKRVSSLLVSRQKKRNGGTFREPPPPAQSAQKHILRAQSEHGGAVAGTRE